MLKLKYYFCPVAVLIFCASFTAFAQTSDKPSKPVYDSVLAAKLGADERGMKMYVLCILKTGPKDADFKGKERQDKFAGHFANINRLAEEGKLAVAGPFGKNDKTYRGLYIFNVSTVEEAEKLVFLDPAVKAGIFVPELTLWYGSAALMATNDVHKKLEKPKQ
ncbi:MAG: YciI family protein [Pyrinomonadaceae bacterium]